MIKGFKYAAATLAYVVGCIGGIDCAYYNKEYFICGTVVILAVMAFPTAKECYKKWWE